METTESPRQERYLISALADSPETLTHLTESLKAAGVAILKTETLGARRLAFPIDKKTELELLSVFFESDPAQIKPLENTLKRDTLLKRFLLTKWSVDPNAEPRSRAKKKVEVAA